jgi:hypothetical protein
MRRQGVRFAVFLSFLLLLIGLSTPILRAQATIDPSLPAAPLPHTGLLTIFPEFDIVKDPTRPVPPLTARQKFEIAYHKICSPALAADALADSAFEQATNGGPAYGQGWGAFGQRVGYNAANFTSKSLFSAGIVPAVFHQDPRYFRLGTGSVAKRMRWILRSQVVAFSDRGNSIPNYGNLLGFGASVALSNAYMPARSVSFVNDVKSYGISFAATIAVDTIYEFDLRRLLQRRLSQP